MKYLPISLAFLGLLLPVAGQDKTEAAVSEQATGKWDVEIPGPISDGRHAPPFAPPVIPRLTVTVSRTFRRVVVEAPPLPGLPPVGGRISVTVRKVVDPGLPGPPKPLPPVSPDDPAVKPRLDGVRESHQGTALVFISATVYDHSRTFLRIYPNGSLEGEVTAWTNIDFNHFSGFGSYRATSAEGETKDYALLMGIGNGDNAPRIPRLRDVTGGPAYLIVDGKDSGSEALATLSQIHDLYAKEGRRMEEAYISRMVGEKKLRAQYLAHPPKPKDVVLNYWRGKRPSNPTSGGEGQP